MSRLYFQLGIAIMLKERAQWDHDAKHAPVVEFFPGPIWKDRGSSAFCWQQSSYCRRKTTQVLESRSLNERNRAQTVPADRAVRKHEDIPGNHVCIDEVLISFEGCSHLRQCTSRRPKSRWGLKMLAKLACVDFGMYQGQPKGLYGNQVGHDLGVGAGVIFWLYSMLRKCNNLIVADNFFTSPLLVNELIFSNPLHWNSLGKQQKQIFWMSNQWSKREEVPLIFMSCLEMLRTSK